MFTKLKMTRGDTASFNLSFTNKSDGTPYDLTGKVIYFTLKTSPDELDSDATFQKTVSSHTNATAGSSAIVLAPSDTVNLPVRTYDYDVRLAGTAGTDKYTVLKGKFDIEYDITRGTAGTAL